MQINRISITNNNYNQTRPIFRASIDDRVRELTANDSWWEKHVNGSLDNARNVARWELDSECSQAERAVDAAREEINISKRLFNEKLASLREILSERNNELKAQKQITKQNDRTINALYRTINDNKSSIYAEKKQLDNILNESRALDEQNEEARKNLNNLEDVRQKSKENVNVVKEEQLEQAKKEIAAEQKQNLKNTEDIMRNADAMINKVIANSHLQTGIKQERLRGYNNEKAELQRLFGKPILQVQSGFDVKVPNGILLFGPQGCGKTTLIREFAKAMNCNVEYYNPTMDSEKAYNQLISILEHAKKMYQQNKKHTFIIADEFDSFAPKDTAQSARMKNLTDKISDDYHCSILATTNYPENIDKILLREGRFEKMPIAPALEEDIKNIVKYYLQEYTIPVEDINMLSHFISYSQSGKYSNSQIKDIIVNCVNRARLSLNDLNISVLIKEFKKNVPVITPDIMNLFQNQIKYVKQI